MMTRWRYRITIHNDADILALLPQPAEQVPPTIFCSDEGSCYFDGGPNPLTDAITLVLNRGGKQGWELLQVSFRPQQMICFWKQRVD